MVDGFAVQDSLQGSQRWSWSIVDVAAEAVVVRRERETTGTEGDRRRRAWDKHKRR